MKYKILKNLEFTLGDYKLVALRQKDMEQIRLWRNQQIEVLRQKKLITKEAQIKYFESIVKPTFDEEEPPQILFSFLKKDSLIGYGGLVHFDWEFRRAEVSFLVDPKRAQNETTYSQDFSAYLALIKRIAFGDLGLNRIFAETYAIRKVHLAILEKNDFIYEGTFKGHVKIKGEFVDSLIHAVLKEEYEFKK